MTLGYDLRGGVLFLCPHMVEGCLLEEVAFHLHLMEVGRSGEEENMDGKTLVGLGIRIPCEKVSCWVYYLWVNLPS